MSQSAALNGQLCPIRWRQQWVRPANWPIPLDEISTKVHLWHAERDPLVGNMTLYLAGRLPQVELRRLPDQGHLWILHHMEEVLADLVE
jgi:hypothetical protein